MAASSEVAVRGLDAPVPQHVREALDQAKDYGHYRDLRVMRFVHLFAGPHDVLGDALKKVCTRENIKLEVEAIDLKMDGTGNLLEDEPYLSLMRRASDDEVDGGHSGFPCGSFSRARYNSFGPDPVRSKKFIYGLPGNSERQQAEADRGTIMAVRSFKILGEILMSQKRRMMPLIGTAENPPGSEDQEEGPAWCLPEWLSFEKEFETVTALYNNCAFQERDQTKWYKPGRLSGCLNNLQGMAKKCSCPPWLKHEALVGKEKTAKAAEYPVAFCEQYAELVVAAFKVTLQLEWWRNMLKVKKEAVSEAQKKWLVSKEKNPMLVTEPSKRVWEVKDPMIDRRPGGQRPAKKARREEENKHFLGGMRNPGKAVAKLTRLQEVGREIRDVWIDFVKDYGSEHCELDKRVQKEWMFCLEGILRMEEFEDAVLREPWEFNSPLNAKLWNAWFKASGDPEKDLVSWIRQGAPLGMSEKVPYCGIYPTTEEDEEGDLDPPNLEFQMGMENYKSFLEEPEHAEAEVRRYLERGFAIETKNEWVVEHFKQGTMSKLALIIKEKDDGSVKRRIIIDLKRSGGNARCRLQERLVLPRVCDVVNSLKYLRANRIEMMERAHAEQWKELDKVDEIELVSADLSDAYCHLPVARNELGNCLAPSNKEGHTFDLRGNAVRFPWSPFGDGEIERSLGEILASSTTTIGVATSALHGRPGVHAAGPTLKAKRKPGTAAVLCGSHGSPAGFQERI